MHLPTYLFLMAAAVLYGIAHAILLFMTNKLLFAVSIFVVLVTIAGAIMQSANADDIEFKWMLWYTIPVGLLVLAGVLGNNELQDLVLAKAGVQPPPHVIPGLSADYENAAWKHFASMLFPIVAALFARLVQFALDIRNSGKGGKNDA